MGERQAKRAKQEKTDDEASLSPRYGHQFGSIFINTPAPVQLGDRYDSCKQDSPGNVVDNGTDHYEVLLKSLLFPRIDARERNVKKALSRTCEWLFRHKEFQTWRTAEDVSEHNGFLWIKGKPGCGKSTIMKTALEWTRKENRKHTTNQTVLHYFFNARAPSSLEKSTLGLYRSLAYHLLTACPSMHALFETKFALKEPGELDNAWTKEELQDFLCDVVKSGLPSNLCIFIDALDEGEHEGDVREMISFLVDLSERAQGLESLCKLRICLSSRHYPHISINKGLSLVVEKQPEHGQDIDEYIHHELTGSDGEDREVLSAEIRRKSSRIFLWVVLVVKMLNKVYDKGGSLEDMKAHLDTIPGDLDELFREVLAKNVDGIEASVALFQWVLFSMRALQAEELYLAIEHCRSPWNAKWSLSHKIKMPSADRLAKYILDCSRGLVELTSAQPPVVQFIHETVREFLLNEKGLASLLPALSTNLQGVSHEVLKTGCLRYLSARAIPEDVERYFTEGHKDNTSYLGLKDELRKQMPFIDYAAFHVYSHAENAQSREITQETFLRARIGADGKWQGRDRLWWNVLEQFKTEKHAEDVTLLYFLAEQGYPSLVSALLKVSNSVNVVCGRHGSALQAASYKGHEKVVQVLLDVGADVNAQGGEYGNALQAALVFGSENVVKVLLDAGANVNAQGGPYGNALQAASVFGHEKVVKLLLDAGADVNAQGGPYGNALQAASYEGHEKVVKILLKHGAQPLSTDGSVLS